MSANKRNKNIQDALGDVQPVNNAGISLPNNPLNGSGEMIKLQPPASEDTDRFLRVIADSVYEDIPPQTPRTIAPSEPSQTAVNNATVAFTAAERMEASKTVPRVQEASAQVSGPVNPLVAAREATNRATANAQDENSLYPISEVDEKKGSKEFDTSFGNKSKVKTVFKVLLVIALLALVGAGAFFGWRYKMTVDAQEQVNTSIEKLASTDTVITGIDSVLATEVDNGLYTGKLSDYMMRTTTTLSALNNAEAAANEALRNSNLLDNKTIDGLNAIKKSVVARRALIDIARNVSGTDTQTQQALTALNSAYDNLAAANENAQISGDQFFAYAQALGENADTTGFNVWDLTQYDNQAIWSTQSAQEQVAAASTLLEGLDTTALTAYIDARLAYLDAVLQFHTAYAEGNTALAEELADIVVSTQEAATAAQAQLPSDAQSMIAPVYANATKDQQDPYNKARAVCVDSDAQVTEYANLVDYGVKAQKTYAPAAVSSQTIAGAAASETPAVPAETAPQTEETSAEQSAEASQNEVPEGEAPSATEEEQNEQ